jgi:hypothetical protein
VANGILASLPATDTIQQALGTAQGQFEQALSDLTDNPARFAEPLLQALGPVTAQLPTDASAWTGPVATLIDGVQGAIPVDIDDLIAPLTDGLNGIRPLIDGSPLGGMLADLQAGRSFTDIAGEQLQGLSGQALGQFSEQLGALLSGEQLAEARAFLDTLASLQGSPPSDPAQLVGLLSEQFLGVPADLLDGAAALSQQRFDSLANVQQVAGSAIDALETELANRLAAAAAHVQGMDATLEGSFQALVDLLNQANGALTALVNGLEAVPAAVSAGLNALDVNGWISGLESALRALPQIDASSLQQVADQLLEPLTYLNDLLATIDPAQLVTQLHGMLNAMLQAVDAVLSFLTDNPIFSFFDDLREKVQVLDVQAIHDGLDAILQRIKEVVDAFDTEAIKGLIEGALGAVETALEAIDLAGAIASCVDLLQQIAGFLDTIPLADVTGAIDGVLATVDGLISSLDAGSQTAAGEIGAVLGQLGNLSFYPQAEPAIEAIEAIAELVASFDLSILPSSMADALRAACREFKDSFGPSPGQHFQQNIVQAVDDAFSEIEDPLRQAMVAIGEKLDALAGEIEGYDPGQWLAPLADLVDRLVQAVGQFSGEELLRPVETARQELLAALGSFSPADLFAPLEQAYDQVLGQLQGFTPGDLLQPLVDLYSTVDGMIQSLDLTAHLNGLGSSASDTFDGAHSQLMGAFDLSSLPGELGDLTGQIQPLLDILTPGTTPEQAASNLQTFFQDMKPGKLFEPLQGVYDDLLGLLDAVSDDVLLEVYGQLKTGLVTNLEKVDPAALSRLLGAQFDALSTAVGTNAPQAVASGLQSGYQALSGAFQAIDAGAVPDALQPLYQQAQALVNSLNPATRLGPLQSAFQPLAAQVEAAGQAADLSRLGPAFGPIGARLEAIVPDFLSHDLTVESIREGMAGLSPAALAARVDEPFDQFYASVQALSPALQAEYESFLDALGEKLMMLNPFAIFDKFRQIYQAIVDQILAVDPQAVADALNDDIYGPLLAKFEVLHPRALRQEVQETFDRVKARIESLDLGAAAAAIDDVLGTLQEKLNELKGVVDAEALQMLFAHVGDALRNLAIVDLFQKLVDALARLADDLDRTLSVAAAAFDEMIAALPA